MNNSIISIGVKSMEESLSFFKDVMDFNLDRRMNPSPGVELCFISNKDQMVIELIEMENVPVPVNSSSSLTLTFMVENLEEKEALLKVKNIKYKTKTLPNRLNVHQFHDPNGISLSFMNTMK